MAKTIQIACYVVALLATMLGFYCLAKGRWGFAAVNAAMVAINPFLAAMVAPIGGRDARP